jgi:phage gp46-like protein
MTDIQTIWDVSTGTGDYEIENGELSKGHDVRTSVLISLFTDRVADVNDELPDSTQDRRGWWGDTGQKYPIGSRLYLLDRSKAPTNIELEAINYASEAVQWMIDDNIVAKFDIQAKFIHNNQLRMIVVAYRQDGSILSKISEELW